MKSFKDFLQETSIAKPKQEFKSSAGAGEDASPELVNNYKKNKNQHLNEQLNYLLLYFV